MPIPGRSRLATLDTRFMLYAAVFALVLSAVALLVAALLRPWLGPESLYFLAAVFLGIAGLVIWLTTAWRRGNDVLAAILAGIPDAVVTTDTSGTVLFLNGAAETLTGWTRQEARGRPASEVLRFIEEKSHQPVENPLLRVLRDGAAVGPAELLLVSRNNTEVPVEQVATPVRDRTGAAMGGILVCRDIAARRHAEAQATQSEKMDAVGRVAAGVAGDFNNLLTVIAGYGELLRAELPSGSPLRRFVEEIVVSGERAAALTRQLLALGRIPTAQAHTIDVNALTGGMEPMLRRLLGEEIELILLRGPGPSRVRADAGQLEQTILNLAANARDAMPNGGKLVIETANVELEGDLAGKKIGVPPGPYVMLAVSDTGVGMDAGTRSRLFEPFFTTKQPGQGTGLGLSMAYGTVRRSGGQITVYSQPGCGTIFEIYLPSALEAPATAAATAKTGAATEGSETILVVDDEEGVRKLVSAVLTSRGYDVMEAASGSAALAAWEKNGHKIDLVLTDVVMPQMDGFELGLHLKKKSPKVRIVYMSGYRDSPIDAQSAGGAPPFLHKPFTPDNLLSKVREALDS